MPVTEHESIEEFTESDGTTVRVRTITTRTTPTTNLSTNLGSLALSSKALPSRADSLKQRVQPSSRSVVSGSTAQFRQDFLKQHNAYRALHNAPPVTLSSTISAHAQEWAMHIGTTGNFQHRPNNPYGENLSMFGSSNLVVNGTDSVRQWYNEEKFYHYYGSEPPMSEFSKWGHFTQVVWKDCTEIGVGVAIVDGNKVYVVGNYNPPGNYGNEFAANVLAKTT